MEVNGQYHVSAAKIPGIEPPVPIGEPVCTLWRREKSLAAIGNRTPAVQPIAIPTELSRIAVIQRVRCYLESNEAEE
jgi:hypothetical protein